ncbi:hypothetical protein I7I53_04080 [Histoplasma capsulatum var. duboisii H88]|uniref:Uncharacterized protein n=1 Tax=Ajellomyces capsulatus (strain H88) TaxID=544711 RepID=A0A8A1LUA4_AJEC8|nr:hypothetical protein I7I53_04080 [Histoplasma capsulatum var. duboisii H88]
MISLFYCIAIIFSFTSLNVIAQSTLNNQKTTLQVFEVSNQLQSLHTSDKAALKSFDNKIHKTSTPLNSKQKSFKEFSHHDLKMLSRAVQCERQSCTFNYECLKYGPDCRNCLLNQCYRLL